MVLRKRLAAGGIETADLDARLLVQAVTGADHAGLILQSERVLTQKEMAQIEEMAQRRLKHEPVSRILGVREFYGRDFLISGDVLDPRPDTETLIDLVLSVTDHAERCDILDIGTGSGAIIITLLCELPHARAVASDISAGAVEITRQNACRHGVENRLTLVETSWCEGIEQQFDLIVSNPPYITRADIGQLAPEVRDYDPILALDGGQDGLYAYRQLAKCCLTRLKQGGIVMLEIGFDQAEGVRDIFCGLGFIAHPNIEMISKDLAGNDRVVTLIRGEVKKGLEKFS